jgi:hypothetical protein
MDRTYCYLDQFNGTKVDVVHGMTEYWRNFAAFFDKISINEET